MPPSQCFLSRVVGATFMQHGPTVMSKLTLLAVSLGLANVLYTACLLIEYAWRSA